MAAIATTLLAERWNDEVILEGLKNDLDGDQDDDWTLPTTLGDVALMEMWVRQSTFATLVATPELLGVAARVVTIAPATVVDIIGVSRWTRVHSAILSTYLSPDPLVLWRQGEAVRLTMPELDSNAVPTADLRVYFKCVRVRPMNTQGSPIQLVR